MEVKIDQRHPVPAAPDAAWAVLADIRALAACMPGAQITEQVDATHYKGNVKSRVGPAVMNFAGSVELLEVDAGARRLRLLAKGADKAGSSATMQLEARLEPGADAASSVLVGRASVVVAGKLAQFGNRLLVPVSDALLQQFAGNFGKAAAGASAAADPSGAGAGGAPSPASGRGSEDGTADRLGSADSGAGVPAGTEAAAVAEAASSGSPGSVAASAASPGPAAASAAAAAPLLPAPPAPPRPTPSPAPPAAGELDALGLLWSVFKRWLAGLFGRRR